MGICYHLHEIQLSLIAGNLLTDLRDAFRCNGDRGFEQIDWDDILVDGFDAEWRG